ncbi:MAG TPA: hypothetical protein VKY31_01250 [Terriglobia bacterium]|nr:hypothetical protein [Terriglobia bacterium]
MEGRIQKGCVPLLALLLFFTTAHSAFAQTFGFKFGYPTQQALQVNNSNALIPYSEHSQAPKFGLTGELGMPFGTTIEIDALYSRWSYSSSFAGSTNINAWEFPVLLKKTLFKGPVRPFVNGGGAFRAINAGIAGKRPIEFIHAASAGYAFGGGLDFKFGRIHLMPEFRYSKFITENFRSPAGTLQTNLHEPMFLLGIERGR